MMIWMTPMMILLKILLTKLLKLPMRKNLIFVRTIVKPSSVSD